MLRALLGAAAVCAAVAVVLVGRGEAAPPSPLPAGTDGLVVLDLSASISTDTYARIGATLDGLAETGGRYGLIVFSDTAYLALPPGTPAAELRAFARRFDLPEQTGGALTVPTSPWTDSFSAGTKISTGCSSRWTRSRRSGSVDRPCSSSATSTTTSATSSA